MCSLFYFQSISMYFLRVVVVVIKLHKWKKKRSIQKSIKVFSNLSILDLYLWTLDRILLEGLRLSFFDLGYNFMKFWGNFLFILKRSIRSIKSILNMKRENLSVLFLFFAKIDLAQVWIILTANPFKFLSILSTLVISLKAWSSFFVNEIVLFKATTKSERIKIPIKQATIVQSLPKWVTGKISPYPTNNYLQKLLVVIVTITHQKELKILLKLCLLPDGIVGVVLSNWRMDQPKNNTPKFRTKSKKKTGFCFK